MRTRVLLLVLISMVFLMSASSQAEVTITPIDYPYKHYSSAMAVNANGAVAAWGLEKDNLVRGFVYFQSNIQDVGFLGKGDGDVYTLDINSEGIVIGQDKGTNGGGFFVTPYDSSGDKNPDTWFSGSYPVNKLMTPFPLGVKPYAINDLNQVLASQGGTGQVYQIKGTDLVLLFKLSSPSSAMPLDINDHSLSAGVLLGGTSWLPVLWNQIGLMMDLGHLGGKEGVAFGINNVGQVVGWSTNPSGIRNAFVVTPLYDSDGVPRKWYVDEDLDGINDLMQPIIADPNVYSEAYGIDDLGQVVGFVSNDSAFNSSGEAFIWDETGGLTRLGYLSCGSHSVTTIGPYGRLKRGINACSQAVYSDGQGRVVGGSENYDPVNYDYHTGVIWSIVDTPQTPSEEIDVIIDDIQDIVASPDSTLSENEATGLMATLESSSKQFNKGNIQAGCNVLNAFVNQTEAKVKSGKISPEEGQLLIEGAKTVSECQ